MIYQMEMSWDNGDLMGFNGIWWWFNGDTLWHFNIAIENENRNLVYLPIENGDFKMMININDYQYQYDYQWLNLWWEYGYQWGA